MNNKFTPISEIGEFELIKLLSKNILLNNKSTKKGIGDDAAAISYLKNKNCLVTTDMLVEGVHFDTTYTPLKHLGYKSIIVNISDICAMNGVATHALLSLGIPNKYSVEHIKELYTGITTACNNYNIDLIGGDTTSSSTGLIINVTMIGESAAKNTTYRAGAQPNDLLFVSGTVGAAYLGLQILEREKMVFNKNKSFKPKLDSYAHILERQLKPEARTDIIKSFKEIDVIPSAMIDVSDGISSDIRHVCELSGVGVKIFEDKIPISGETNIVAKELNINPTICALHGGEDYELLFTVSPSSYKKLSSIEDISPIGHITSQTDTIELITKSNNSIDLSAEGWDSFLPKK